MDIETDHVTIEKRICPECGAEFYPLYNRQACCSGACQRQRSVKMTAKRRELIRARKGLVPQTRACVVCGAAFKTTEPRRKTCSHECSVAQHHKKQRDWHHANKDPAEKAFRDRQRAARREREAERRAFFAARDAAYAANAPRTKVVTRGKIKVELRGTVPVAPWQPKNELRPAGFGWSHF